MCFDVKTVPEAMHIGGTEYNTSFKSTATCKNYAIGDNMLMKKKHKHSKNAKNLSIIKHEKYINEFSFSIVKVYVQCCLNLVCQSLRPS